MGHARILAYAASLGGVRTRERLVILHSDAFALVDGRLPEAGLADRVDVQDSIAPLADAARHLVGAPLTYLMRLLDPGGNVNVFACDDAPAPQGWRGLEELDAHLDPSLAAAVREPTGPPWYRRAFHAELLALATHVLDARSLRVERAEPVRISPLSCVYRLTCGGDPFWIKATRPGAFVPEGAIMSALAQACPALVPEPLAFGEHWLLTADFGQRLQEHTDARTLGRVLGAFAELQVGAGRLRELPGLQSWRVADLMSDLERSRAALGDEADGVLARVAQDVDALGAIGMDETLVHGDLYWGNVALDGDRIRLFDWSDAGVSHPFLDPMDIHGARDGGRRDALARAYLAPWRAALDVDVDVAWRIAGRLSPAHLLARNSRLLGCLEPFELATIVGGERWFADATRRAYA